MTESTVRAERFEPQSSATLSYTWAVPQKPLSVRIPFALIDRLEHEAVESFRSLHSRGSEIGGLLLGRVPPRDPTAVSIEDYELVACDYSRGPLYRLSDADMGRFERAIEQRRVRAGGLVVAGFFRSHTRKGLALDADDLALFKARFADPRKVALLIRPFATKASTAGIFIWEDGAVRGDASHLEFPFRSSELTPSKPVEEASQPLPEAAQPAPPEAAAPKPQARAQIVPIASRREMAPAGSASFCRSARTGNRPREEPGAGGRAPRRTTLWAPCRAPLSRMWKRRRRPARSPLAAAPRWRAWRWPRRPGLWRSCCCLSIRASCCIAASRPPVCAAAGFFAAGLARGALGGRTHADMEPRVQRHQERDARGAVESPTARSTRTSIWISPCSAAAVSSIHPPAPTWFSGWR